MGKVNNDTIKKVYEESLKKGKTINEAIKETVLACKCKPQDVIDSISRK